MLEVVIGSAAAGFIGASIAYVLGYLQGRKDERRVAFNAIDSFMARPPLDETLAVRTARAIQAGRAS